MNSQDTTKPHGIESERQSSSVASASVLSSDLPSPENGGQTTISPPAKVKSTEEEEFLVLASGIDTLYLAIDVHWGSHPPIFFLRLEDLKAKAKEDGEEKCGAIKHPDGSPLWQFTIPPFGNKGYEWILNGKDFTFKIGSWLKPQSRPSILVEIRSETLWHLGPKEAVSFILELLLAQGAKNIRIKPSRVDLCIDLLAPATFWTLDLIQNKTTRAQFAANYFHNRTLTGIGIGRGKLSARLYDKPLEIRQQSKKFWMYDIWGLESVPEGKIIVRVEFQLRREILVELGLKSIAELFSHYQNAWKYCSENWLKFQTNPGKHHTQRKTFAWWTIIQNGFDGAQEASPLVRCKAVRQQKAMYLNQMMGAMSSLSALKQTENLDNTQMSVSIGKAITCLIEHKKQLEENGKDFSKIVQTKIAKNMRLSNKQSKAFLERQKNGFPTGN